MSAIAVLSAVAWQPFIVVLPIATALWWWAWRSLQQETILAIQIVAELSRKFEGER